MLALKINQSTASDWFGIAPRLIHDADMLRFLAIQRAATQYLTQQGKK